MKELFRTLLVVFVFGCILAADKIGCKDELGKHVDW